MKKEERDTAIYLLQKSLKRSENSYRKVLTIASDGIFLLYLDGFYFVNPAFARLLEVPPGEDLIGKQFLSFAAPECVPALTRRILASTDTDFPVLLPEQLLSYDHSKTIDVDMAFVTVDYEGTRCIQGIVRSRSGGPVTPEIQTYIQHLAERIEQLSAVNRELKETALAASCDLQHPFHMISNCIQKLTEVPLSETKKEYLNRAVNSTEQAEQLVKHLIQDAAFKVKPDAKTEADLSEILRLAQQNLEADLLNAGAGISIGPMPKVMVYRNSMVRLFENLISNAISRCADRPLQLTVLAEEKEELWNFTVKDNGSDMPPEHQEIFHGTEEPPSFSAAGAGLWLCKTIVERHGGQIGIYPDPEKGFQFKFSLPKK